MLRLGLWPRQDLRPGIAPRGNREAIYQGLFEEAKKQIAFAYLLRKMVHIREDDQNLYDEILITDEA
jgi:hypothetical protein